MAEFTKNVEIKSVKWFVMKKSTWTPNLKDFWDNETYKPYIDVLIDTFTFVDAEKNEYKLIAKAWEKKLDFWDSWTLKIVFEKS